MNPQFDADNTLAVTRTFIANKLEKSGLNGYVVGLSGGIDSAVSAALAVQAVGKAKIMGVLLPYKTSSAESVADAMELVEKLGIEYRQVDITPMIDAYFPVINDDNRMRAGNKMARERMSILFDIAYERGCLVLGTGNRTEICLGYTTWYGDAACSLNPIGELYKTEIRRLAEVLGIPRAIIDKVPSADLWEGQTDEAEIGVTYERIDQLLRRIVDDGVVSMSALEAEQFHTNEINRVVSLLNTNAFKRRMAEFAPLGKKPIPDNVVLKQ